MKIGDMIATCMAWLNDVKAGGGTAFIHPGEELLIEGRKGSMAFWIDTKANTAVLPNASHGGCPVSIKKRFAKVHARTRSWTSRASGRKTMQARFRTEAFGYQFYYCGYSKIVLP